MIIKSYLILIIFILLFYSCKKDIAGHWHAISTNSVHKYGCSIDIEKNNDCFLIDELKFQLTKGKHYPEENSIFFPGECGSLSFKYKLKGNTLYLENSLGAKLTAKKEICHRIYDYKTELKIDFLTLNKLTKDTIYNLQDSDNEYINIGYSKKDHTLKIETSSYSSYGQPKTINTLDSLFYKIAPNYLDEDIPLINYILTPDRNLKANLFNTILEKLNKSGEKKIYIRTLKNNFTATQRDIFEYIRIKEGRFSFDSEKPLFEIIN